MQPGDWVMGVLRSDATLFAGSSAEPVMVPWPDLLAHPTLSAAASTTQWAERHLVALNENLKAFAAAGPNEVILRATFQAKSGYHVFTPSQIPEFGFTATLFEKSIADVASNLHAALGQFVWALAEEFAAPGKPRDAAGVNYPITDDESWFTSSRPAERTRKQVAEAHWKFISRFQAFDGRLPIPDSWSGDYVHPLVLLKALANDHKHTATQPVLLVPSQFAFKSHVKVAYRLETYGDATMSIQDMQFGEVGRTFELDTVIVRMRLEEGAPNIIEKAGSFTPQIAIAGNRPAAEALVRIYRFVHFILSEFYREFPP